MSKTLMVKRVNNRVYVNRVGYRRLQISSCVKQRNVDKKISFAKKSSQSIKISKFPLPHLIPLTFVSNQNFYFCSFYLE